MPLDPPTDTATPVRDLPLAHLRTSSTHVQALRRARFRPEATAELADSIRRLGVLQPIVVRLAAGGDHFEIVAGERRYLAARQAGLTTIPASIRQLSDAEVIEAQVTENLQREDLHPMEEAEGYEELRKTAGLSIDELIAKVGKSRSWVFGRLKLLDLAPPARTAFLAGEINASIALELARISHAGTQAQALEALQQRAEHNDGAISVREATHLIRDEFLLRLERAPWPLDDAGLLASAGACTACPKRSGNQPELFEADTTDLCTDAACFAAKRAAHTERALAQARESGQVVITGKAAKKVLPYEYDRTLRGYQRLDAPCYQVPGNKTLRQVLKKDPPPAVLIEDPHTGGVIEALRDDEVERQLKARGLLDGKRASSSGADNSWKREQKKRADKTVAENAVRRATWLRVREKLADGRATLDDWRMVAEAFFADIWHEHRKRVCKQWGWEHDRAIAKHLAALTAEQVALFMFDCALVIETYVGPYEQGKAPRLAAAAERHGVDVAPIRKELAAEVKAKGAAKKGKK